MGAATGPRSVLAVATLGSRAALGGDLARPAEVRRRRRRAAVHLGLAAPRCPAQGASPPPRGPSRRRGRDAGAGPAGAAGPWPEDQPARDAPARAALGARGPRRRAVDDRDATAAAGLRVDLSALRPREG